MVVGKRVTVLYWQDRRRDKHPGVIIAVFPLLRSKVSGVPRDVTLHSELSGLDNLATRALAS